MGNDNGSWGGPYCNNINCQDANCQNPEHGQDQYAENQYGYPDGEVTEAYTNGPYNRGFGKANGTAMYPVHAEQTSGLLKRSEPPLTPEQLVSRYLKGIPLTFDKEAFFSPEDLKDQLNLATNEAELLLGRNITRERFKEKVPFDYSLYRSYIHVRAEHGPIVSIQQLAIVSADNHNIFEIPPDWIETTNFSKQLINVIPLLAAYGVNSVQGAVGNAGIAFLTVIDGLNWVPAYWQIRYDAGLATIEGRFPVPVNDLIGCVAAINILSIMATLNITTSQSLSQDGISQSSSSLGPRIYQLRIEELTKRRDELTRKLKSIFSSRYFIGNF